MNDRIFLTALEAGKPSTLLVDILSLLAVLLAGIGVAAYGGFIFTTLWGWYLVPAGLPAVTIKTAIGVMIISRLISLRISVDQLTPPSPDDAKKAISHLGTVAAGYSIAFGLGAMWNWFI